jgi:hypothetical protein
MVKSSFNIVPPRIYYIGRIIILKLLYLFDVIAFLIGIMIIPNTANRNKLDRF